MLLMKTRGYESMGKRPYCTGYLSDRAVDALEALTDYIVLDSCSWARLTRSLRNMAFRKAYEREGKITRAAKVLGIGTTALYREFNRYGK